MFLSSSRLYKVSISHQTMQHYMFFAVFHIFLLTIWKLYIPSVTTHTIAFIYGQEHNECKNACRVQIMYVQHVSLAIWCLLSCDVSGENCRIGPPDNINVQKIKTCVCGWCNDHLIYRIFTTHVPYGLDNSKVYSSHIFQLEWKTIQNIANV